MRRISNLAAVGIAATTAALLLQGLGWAGDEKPKSEPPKGDVSTSAKPCEDTNDPLGANAACYVCHMTFVKEDLAKKHLKAKVGCVQCHGLSDKHANDENIGGTKPDIVFPRKDIDASCGKCHEGHDAPAAKVVARFVERHLPANEPPTCTDCHGTHKIQRAAAKP